MFRDGDGLNTQAFTTGARRRPVGPASDLEQLVRLLARQAARRQFRLRGYTIIQVPLLLGGLAFLVGAALVFLQLFGR